MANQEGFQKAGGSAFVLAIGTAKPKIVIHQPGSPDLYFQVTDSENSTGLKGKFERICDKNITITERHMHLTLDLLKKDESKLTGGAPSLNVRQDGLVSLVKEQGKEAASAAIKNWGQPKSKITHLMFHSTSGVHMPGADCWITNSLGLPLGVKRTMLYHQGSYVGGTLLRIAKDTAENNPATRILILCSEITLGPIHGPCEADLGSLLAKGTIGNGAAALIVGTDPDKAKESPLFELMSASQTIVPDSDSDIEGYLREMGLTFRISERVPELISGHTEKFLRDLLDPFKMAGDWNKFFWAIHTGSRETLDKIADTLGLNDSTLEATRLVLHKYGNIGSASVFFVLDEIRGRKDKRKERGILFAFGAGLTLDAVLLRRI